MTYRRDILALGLAAPILAGCRKTEESWTLRYRLKVRIFCGGETHEGASVFETRYTRKPKQMLNRFSEFGAQTWGEAIVVDCGETGPIFAILRGSEGVGEGPTFDPLGEQTLVTLLDEDQNSLENFNSGRAFELVRELKGEQQLPSGAWPALIRFEDKRNPKTARLLVSPGQSYAAPKSTISEALNEHFGEGARVESVTIEMTADPASQKILSILPWLKTFQGAPGHSSFYIRAGSPLGEMLQYDNYKLDGDRQ